MIQEWEARERKTDPAYMNNITIIKQLSGYQVYFFVLIENFFDGRCT